MKVRRDSRYDGLVSACQQVPQLKRLYQVRIPDHGSILDADILPRAQDAAQRLDTVLKRVLCAEHGRIVLHRLLHVQSDLGRRLGAVGGADLVQSRDRVETGVGRDLLVRLPGLERLRDVVGDSATEDDNVEERVGTETVRAVDGNTGGLAGGVETRHDLVLAVLVNGQDLTGVLGGDTTHVVMDGRQDGNRLLGDVDTGKNRGRFRDTGQSFVQDLWRQVGELEVAVVLFGTDTATFADLDRHRTRDDVTRGQILRRRRVSLHESFTLRVEQVSTFTSRALRDQAACTVDTCGVELHKFEILQRQARTRDHTGTVTGAGVGRGAREVGTPVTTGGQNGLVRSESVHRTILLVVGHDTDAFAVLHDQICAANITPQSQSIGTLRDHLISARIPRLTSGKVLDEIFGVVAKRLAVEGVQHGVTGSVSGGSASVRLSTLAELERLTTERALVNFALLGAGEGKTVVLELENRVRRLSAHVVDGILVGKPIATLDGVVRVPSPVVFGHVAERGVDTTLRGDGVGSGREKLGNTGDLQSGLGKTESCSKTGTTSPAISPIDTARSASDASRGEG
ncbi:BQ5605_C012g07003 [Microbotryum silenes-dioicae]|uniref:BQ5605_C012g07003 protein n=1 Tax=Microbotryum silenes-dioicae TaxID=796604 RepID=A0A2X0LW91_9BASI|nr:BQ5605_C012g07003 [Microbotryum silenes-dioicae]